MFDELMTLIQKDMPDYEHSEDDFELRDDGKGVFIHKWNLPIEKPSKDKIMNTSVVLQKKKKDLSDLAKEVEDQKLVIDSLIKRVENLEKKRE